ncbi:MAG: lamin tail domain-containing protein, partial [Verrucomicrobia bacterium]|nr:lamin tail domain-containing protein [Verrucomicrobiota bacterium]
MKQSCSSLLAGFSIALACLSLTARAEQVVISEIMYHPPGDLPEFIEVQNNTSTPLDMAEWRLRDGADYDFPAFNPAQADQVFLKPFERILLTSTDPAAMRSAYNVPANIRIFGPWSGALDNAGERITLKDKNGVSLCTVAYNDRGRWPVAADGAGHTLVLRNPDRHIDDVRNWTISSKRLGTPGTEPAAAPETPVTSPEVNLSEGIPFVNYGDTWRFHDQNVDLLTAWRAPDFDDSSWAQGPGLFGFENAALPSPGIRTPFADINQLTYYARTRFTYNGPITGVTLSIDQIIDDGAVYYLNGTELGRSGMPGGAIGFGTRANRTVGDATEELNVITVPGTSLREGVNVLAAEVHQVGATSSDIVFGARLKISAPSQPSLLINEVLPGIAGTGFVEFFNPRATNVNLRNHYITDDPGNLAKFRIDSDIVVPPSGLASIGFTESGLAVRSPVRVYLVDTDGLTILNAIDSAIPLDGRSLGRKPSGGGSWFLFTDPTRNAPNASVSGLAASLRLNEVHFSTTNTIDWVELRNGSDTTIPLNGLFLASRSDLTDRISLTGSVAAGGFVSRDTSFRLSGGEATVFLVNASGTVLGAQVF